MTIRRKLGLEQHKQLLYSFNFVLFKGDKKREKLIAVYWKGDLKS